jgi:hypothetical protein
MIIMKMRRKSFYPSRTTRARKFRLRRSSRWINRRVRGIGAVRQRVVWRACHPCIKISRVGEQIKRDISEDRGGTRWTRRKRLHITKEPMFPKCDMTGNTKTLSNGIITTISFMFYAITKKTTDRRTRF